MDWTVATYLVYLLVTVQLVAWVAHTLSSNGRVFLEEVFAGDERLAHAVNRLLVVGFYLLNLGFVSLFLRTGGEVADLQGLIEQLSVKIGVILLVLGALHFTNVMVFSSMRRRHQMDSFRSAPIAPQGFIATAPYPAPGR